MAPIVTHEPSLPHPRCRRKAGWLEALDVGLRCEGLSLPALLIMTIFVDWRLLILDPR